ncbi:MAG: hypothetical protein JXA28_07140 [Bacteroidetes bacterium]|nr:hypothetical protein [Bacteroidota bacterium]
MIQQRERYFASVAQRLQGGSLVSVCAAFALFLSACGTISMSFEEEAKAAVSVPPARFSFVFVIHGDGDYVYHDTKGRARNADWRTLRAAILLARRLPDTEIFIFHQHPAYKLLYFIPLPDGDFQYYRNGELVAREPYWRSDGPLRFEAEIALYQKTATAAGPERTNFFLYFGHEISEFDGAGYDASTPERTFSVQDLSAGLKSFTGDTTRYDLLVLSTCFGGTPHTIAALAPYSRTIVASPDNLHLSYFDLRGFARLEEFSARDDMPGFAHHFARQAFNRLSESVQTSVTVAVYEPDRAMNYLLATEGKYRERLSALKDHTPESIEYVDCGDEGSLVLPGMSDGVSILFRSSRFGRAKNKRSHSGWQCCRLVTR